MKRVEVERLLSGYPWDYPELERLARFAMEVTERLKVVTYAREGGHEGDEEECEVCEQVVQARALLAEWEKTE